jgi:hypothetical protein
MLGGDDADSLGGGPATRIMLEREMGSRPASVMSGNLGGVGGHGSGNAQGATVARVGNGLGVGSGGNVSNLGGVAGGAGAGGSGGGAGSGQGHKNRHSLAGNLGKFVRGSSGKGDAKDKAKR